jgi:hypothetical protein
MDPLTDIMAPSAFGTDCPPIYREVCLDLNLFPDIQPLTIERVARIYNVPAKLLEGPRPRVSAKRARRPWVPAEALDATQVLPVIGDGEA